MTTSDSTAATRPARTPTLPVVLGVKSCPSWDEVRWHLVSGPPVCCPARKVARCQARKVTPHVVSIDFQRRNLLSDPVACLPLVDGRPMSANLVRAGRVRAGPACLVGRRSRTDAGSTGAGKNSIMWCRWSPASGHRDGLVGVSGIFSSCDRPPAAVMATLTLRRASSRADVAAAVVGGDDAAGRWLTDLSADGPLFADSLGGLRDPSNTMADLRDTRGADGFAWVTSHAFRKTAVTLLDEAAHRSGDRRQFGHSKPSMTQDVYLDRKLVNPAAAQALEGAALKPPPGFREG
jgi:hypothetical protein